MEHKRYICPICDGELAGKRFCPVCKRHVKEPWIYTGGFLPNEIADYYTVSDTNPSQNMAAGQSPAGKQTRNGTPVFERPVFNRPVYRKYAHSGSPVRNRASLEQGKNEAYAVIFAILVIICLIIACFV